LRYFALIPLLFFFVQTWADEAIDDVDLVCDVAANLAVVRFTNSDGGNPTIPHLPRALDHGLSVSAEPRRTECTLANGTTIKVRGGREQAFGYGAGGGNPPAFFSLWINRRKVISREVWKPGYETTINNPPIYNGLLIAAEYLTICATAEGNPQRCTSRPLNLTQAPIDHVEFASIGQKVPVGHISVIAKGAANQRFCRDYLSLTGKGLEGALRGESTPLDIDLEAFTKQAASDGANFSSGLVDLLPGVRQRLWIWAGATHYFDGEVIALSAPGMATKNIVSAYRFKDIDGWPDLSAPQGITLISGGQKQLYPNVSPRYVHLVPQAINRGLYVFAYPTNNKERPTAALLKPLAGGGFVTLCAFNRTEPHY
jgi:hypothetical protein